MYVQFYSYLLCSWLVSVNVDPSGRVRCRDDFRVSVSVQVQHGHRAGRVATWEKNKQLN